MGGLQKYNETFARDRRERQMKENLTDCGGKRRE